MRAMVYERFGPPEVLRCVDMPEPPQREGYVRVAVRAAALNPKDVLVRKGRLRWLTKGRLPRVPGYDVAGELIDPLGSWSKGTPIFGMVQSHSGGTCAQVVSLRADEVALAPDGLSMNEAAALPLAGLTALQGLRDGLRLDPSEDVLIHGASGGVGTLAVQIAKALGAQVRAVCSGRNRELVESLGADEVIDYRSTEVTQLRASAVFDVFGSLPGSALRKMARRRSCTTVPRIGTVLRGLASRCHLGRHSLVVVKSHRRDLDQLSAYVRSGALRPVIDRVYPLEASARGHGYLETRRARGKVVIEVGP